LGKQSFGDLVSFKYEYFRKWLHRRNNIC